MASSQQIFDLALLNKSNSHESDENKEISCLHGAGNTLFVGYADGSITAYSVREHQADGGQVKGDEWTRAKLPTNEPIEEIQSASALAILIVLTDHSVYFLRLQDLSVLNANKRLTGVTCFTINENSTTDDPFVIQMAVGTRRKQILLCAVSATKGCTVVNEIPTQQIPYALGFDGCRLVYGTESDYCMISLSPNPTGSGGGSGQAIIGQQQLFEFNPEEVDPVVKKIGKEEFMVIFTSGLGIVVNEGGAAARPPIPWDTRQIRQIAHMYPYYVAMGSEHITVCSSIDDEDVKQQLPFINGRSLGNFDGQLFAASNRFIYKLRPVSWEKQIDALLADKKVDVALNVARSAAKTGTMSTSSLDIFQHIEQKAVFINLEKEEWDEALEYAISSQLDLREIIVLYPNLLPSTSHFTRAVPPLHSILSIQSLTKNSAGSAGSYEAAEEKAWEFLYKLLERCQDGCPWTISYKTDLDCVRVKVSAYSRSQDLETLLAEVLKSSSSVTRKNKEHHESQEIDLDDLSEWFRQNSCHHALALMNHYEGKDAEAWRIWKRLELDEMQDPGYPGLDALINNSKLTGAPKYVVLDVGRWMRTNKMFALSMKLFLNLSNRTELVQDVLSILRADQEDRSSSSSVSLMSYLEKIVYDCDSVEVDLHNELCELYIKLIISDNDNNSANSKNRRETAAEGSRRLMSAAAAELRQKLRRFLLQTDRYEVDRILPQLQNHFLFTIEAAFVLGKMGNHEEAISLLVGQLNDLDAAEEYVTMFGENRPPAQRRLLHSSLFRVLANTKINNDTPYLRIGKLLNRPDVQVNMDQVLNSLPGPSVSFKFLLPYFLRAVRGQQGRIQDTALRRAMLHARLNDLKTQLAAEECKEFKMALDSRCSVCNDEFSTLDFIRYPTGAVIHEGCLRYRHLCPQTNALCQIERVPH